VETRSPPVRQWGQQLTLLNAVLLGTALGLSTRDALDALIEVVLGRGALLRVPALWEPPWLALF
jgi:hypothetical protein